MDITNTPRPADIPGSRDRSTTELDDSIKVAQIVITKRKSGNYKITLMSKAIVMDVAEFISKDDTIKFVAVYLSDMDRI